MKKEQLFNQCKLNDLIENYPQMLTNLFELSTIDYEILPEELDLYTRCFKCYIGLKRNQYRKIMALIAKDSLVDHKANYALLEILRTKLSSEIIVLCNQVITICENILQLQSIINQKQKKVTLFFTKTLADHYRYIYEINEEDDAKEKARQIYQAALKIIEEGKFLPTDITYLTFYLNYCVFLHDTLGDKTEAIKVAKSSLHAALKDTEEIVDNSQKDIILICQMIKDNLALWKNEMPDELNMI